MSKFSARIAVVVAGLFVLTAVMVVWRGGAAKNPELADPQAERIATLEGNLDEMRRELEAVQRQGSRIKGDMREDGGSAAYQSSAPLDAAVMKLESDRAATETTRRMEAAWANQTEAPLRAAKIEQKMLDATRNGLSASARDRPVQWEANCRESMCRIEAGFAPGADGNDWTTRLLLDMGGTLSETTSVEVRAADGSQRIVVYAYQPGRAPRR